MKAGEIAAALGGAHQSGGRWRCRCPVHASKGASLALRDGNSGLLVHCHAGCSRADILAELRRRGWLSGESENNAARPNPATITHRREADTRDRVKRIMLARDIIASALPATGTVVERYLLARIPGIASVPAVIRQLSISNPYAWHSRSNCRRPVMLAIVEHIDHGIVGAHRTWLTVDGSAKASVDPVRISNGPIGGGAVRLAPAAETLMVGEGIETCLAAMTATRIPAWAALSTSGLVALVLPPAIRTIIILADNDPSGAGERAAYAAADRWLAEGRRVRIALPPVIGTDWADVLTGRDVGSRRAVA